MVNNNAAALVLALAALAQGREVVVSRGELVEIGGSFRIPEIMAAAGARLVEVGATNRTRLADYEAAVGPETALLLKVFPSNFRHDRLRRLGGAAAARGAGPARRACRCWWTREAGCCGRTPAPQLAGHPSLAELIAQGCDLACGSGDKLLGGPQAGLLVGRADLLERCRRHPLYRALRPDRMALAALEGVLRLHLAEVPLPLDRLWPDPEAHRARLERAAAALGAEIVPAEAFLGGGSAPEAPIPGEALALPGDDALLARLRLGDPPVVGYLRQDQLHPGPADRGPRGRRRSDRRRPSRCGVAANPNHLKWPYRPHPDRRGPRLAAPHAGAGPRPGRVRGGGGGRRPVRHPAARGAPLRLSC